MEMLDVDRNGVDMNAIFCTGERMDGDTLELMVARSELDKDTMVLLYDDREWQNWMMGFGGLGHVVGAAGRLGEQRTRMDEGTVVLLDGRDVDEDGWGHAGAAGRDIGAG